MSKPAFTLPKREAEQRVDDWVTGGGEGTQQPAAVQEPPRPQRRLTIDLDAELHARFKSTCALRGTNMVDEVRDFIEKCAEQNHCHRRHLIRLSRVIPFPPPGPPRATAASYLGRSRAGTAQA